MPYSLVHTPKQRRVWMPWTCFRTENQQKINLKKSKEYIHFNHINCIYVNQLHKKYKKMPQNKYIIHYL